MRNAKFKPAQSIETSRVVGRGATSRLLAVASIVKQNLIPHPLYNKVKNNLRRLFFTKESRTCNGKFNQTKFYIFKMQVSVRKIQILVKFSLKFY